MHFAPEEGPFGLSEVSLPFSAFPRTDFDDELRVREQQARESELGRMRSRTGDSVRESSPPRLTEPDQDQVHPPRVSPDPDSSIAPCREMPPKPDPNLDGSSVSPSAERPTSHPLRARLAERGTRPEGQSSPPHKRLCRLIPLTERGNRESDCVGPPRDIDPARLAALEKMAAEKGSYLEWYETGQAASTSSGQEMGGEAQAWKMRREEGKKPKETIYYHPYPTDEEVAQIHRYQTRMVYSSAASESRYIDKNIDKPRSRSARAFREIQDRAAMGRAGAWPTKPRKFPIPTLPVELSQPSDPPPVRQGEWGWSSLTRKWKWYPQELPEQPSSSSLDRPPGDLGILGQSSSRNDYPQEIKDQVLSGYLPPGPEQAKEVTHDAIDKFLNDAKAAYDRGVWQTDASVHARDKVVDKAEIENGTTIVQPQPGKRTLRMAYFFSGVKRKASIGDHLERLCRKEGLGLVVHEVDVLVGGSEHDLLDGPSQDRWIARLEDGEFDCIMLSPPCGTWSRCQFPGVDRRKPTRLYSDILKMADFGKVGWSRFDSRWCSTLAFCRTTADTDIVRG